MTGKTRFMFRGMLLIPVLVFLLACTGENPYSEQYERVRGESPKEVPVVLPNALVDQNGYRTGGEKTVLFRTDPETGTFELRGIEDDAVVYTGSIRKKKDGETETSYGQFSSYQTPGEYYIYTETSGSSYRFVIDDALSERLKHNALQALYAHRCGVAVQTETLSHEPCHTEAVPVEENKGLVLHINGGWHTDERGSRAVYQGSRALRTLLLICELYEETLTDTQGIPESGNGIPDLLDEARAEADFLLQMQTAEGGVYEGVFIPEGEGSPVIRGKTNRAALSLACSLAHCSMVFRPYDGDYADTCLKAAERAYADARTKEDLTENREAFAAASVLYRATGDRTYEQVLSAFFGREDFETLFRQDADCFYGGIMYLFTGQPVNVRVSETLQDALEFTAKEIAARSEASASFVSSEDPALLLFESMQLVTANHLTYHHEYARVAENHLHYLSGQNEDAVNYLGTATERTYADASQSGIPEDVEQLTALLLLLGGA